MRINIETIKGDEKYDLVFHLKDFNNNPINLNSASGIKFKVQKKGGSVLKFEGDMEVVDGVEGEVKYTVVAGNFDEIGKYYAEIEAKFEDGQNITFDDILIKVKSDLPK